MCMRFWPEWTFLRNGLRSGQWGAVQQARFERIGAIPSWGGDFFKDHTKSGGAILDLHIHDVDFVRSCFGAPDGLHVFGRRGVSGGFDHVHAVFEFEGIPGGVHAEGAWLEGDVPFTLRFLVVCERAVLRYDINATPTLSVHATDGSEPMDFPISPRVRVISIRRRHSWTRYLAKSDVRFNAGRRGACHLVGGGRTFGVVVLGPGSGGQGTRTLCTAANMI